MSSSDIQMLVAAYLKEINLKPGNKVNLKPDAVVVCKFNIGNGDLILYYEP